MRRRVYALVGTVLLLAPSLGATDDATARRAEEAAARAEAAARRSEAAATRTEEAIQRLERVLDEFERRQAPARRTGTRAE